MDKTTLISYFEWGLNAIKSFLQLPPEVLLAIASALMLLYVYLVIRHAYTPIALAKSDVGRIRVTRMALKSLARSVCKQIGLEKRVGVSVEFSRGKVNIAVRLGKIDLNQSLSTVVQQLQGRLTEALRNTLGVENVGKVDILVSGFKAGKAYPVIPPAMNIPDKDPFADLENNNS